MRLMLALFLILTSFFYSISSLAQSEKLIFVIDLIRHGDRTATIDLPTTAYSWPQGLGQLTARGMHQEFLLGKAWRKRYIQEQHLLPEHYAVETLYVRASDFDRTLMSAQSALLGLYPLGTGPHLANGEPALAAAYQPIPIHTMPRAEETILLPDHDKIHYQQLLQDHVFIRADWKEKTKKLEPQFARWTMLTGVKITSLQQVISLGDTLYIRELYRLPLPKGMSAQEAETIKEAGRWAFTTIFQTKEVGEATGNPLLYSIINYLHQSRDPGNRLKFILFSAHDSTIASLMSALHAPLKNPPPYASDVNIALYKTASGDFTVKFRFNDQDIPIPDCSGGSVCRLAELETMAKGFH